jgi:protein-tyrosine kinase
VSYYERSSLKSEQYRSLRTRLISANTQNEHQVFAVSSAVPREGKTVTSVNLGFSLAEIPHLKVLIVDGDFRQGRVSKLTNVEDKPGMADLLQGNATFEEVVRPSPIPNLSIIPAGKTGGRSATELLSRKTSRATFDRIRREFHYTVVDTPPANALADIGIIGQMSTGVIFVIRMHRTPEPLARRAIKHIQSYNVPIIGGLLVGEDASSTGYGKQYNYYRYYKYYADTDGSQENTTDD